MNVMKEAHKAVRQAFAKVGAGIKLEYRPLFRAALIDLHKKAKAMQAQETIKLSEILETLKADTRSTGFAIVGTVYSEGEQVFVGEHSGSEERIQSDANYYMNKANGYTKQDLYLEFYGVEGCKKSLKITK